MQKKLIALAVAGLASAGAFAQSNVTVYGMVDGYVGNFRGDNGTRVTAFNTDGLAPGRIGFKGSEDLGNGLKAIFTLEYGVKLDALGGTGSPAAAGAGLAPTANNGLGYSRQTFVGLSSNFGTVVGGVLQTPSFDWAVKYNAMGPSAVIDPYNVLAAGSAANNIVGVAFSGSNRFRIGNAVAYVSPNLYGVTLKAAHAFVNPVEANNSGARLEASSFSADYDNGPLAVGAYYNTVNSTAGMRDYGLGATYDFGLAKLYAAYGQSRNNQDNQVADVAYNATTGAQTAFAQRTTNKADKLWSLGVSVKAGANGSVKASYASLNRSSASTGMTYGGVALGDAKMWTLAYTHSLSKRTTAYAGYMRLTNDQNGQLALGGVAVNAGNSSSGLFAGLNHTF